MCGIFGYFDQGRASFAKKDLQKMADSIDHRGPDDLGIYVGDGCGIGNQRLAIIDIEHGQQPFISEDGSVYVVQNGEIFNHVELSRELAAEGFPCRTKSDTEVILRLYQHSGIRGLNRLNGMFAIAIYDQKCDALFLVRDRVGEKPLYYYYDGIRFVFASEIKAILALDVRATLCHQALSQYLSFNYVPPPLTMFEGIRHVLPGHWMRVTRGGIESGCWWDLADIDAEERVEAEWIDEFNHILDDAVRLRLRADVPFGAFLSGGVDSSTVVGLMSRHLEIPVKTFCIGFDDPRYDESPHALEASRRFGTEHVMERVNPDVLDTWSSVVYHCDQPHGDVSFLPTLRVAELAAKHVKMVLTGDGADELFAGYDKYVQFFHGSDWLSGPDSVFRRRYYENIVLFSDDAKKRLCTSELLGKFGDADCGDVITPLLDRVAHMDRINQALYLDMLLLLPGNNLVKPDRMTMAVSIENRAPFLDYRMMEFAFRLPGPMKLRGAESKYILKKAVTPLIGEALAYRKKQMFTVPIGEWFRDGLAELCQDLLLSSRARARGLFLPLEVEEMLRAHRAGTANFTREIRALMALEIWFRRFVD